MKSSMRMLVAAAALAIYGTGVARADSTIVVTPNDLVGPTFFSDPDTLPPGAESGDFTKGTGAFTASVTKNGATPGDRYRTFRVSLNSLFGSTVTVNDLTSFSYDNHQLTGTDAWRISIYTNKLATDTTFYHSRIQAFPQDSASGFQTESSNPLATNPLLFTDNSPASATGTKFSGDTWGQAQGIDGSQTINFVDITLGANSGGNTESANLDNVEFTVGGNTITLDLEPNAAPLPNSAWAGAGLLGVLGIGAMVRRKRATV